jgi:hydrogenase nickel incorporation protein HypA/HybF
MHEVGMMQSLLKTAVEQAKRKGAEHIRLVQMRVGDASGVTLDSLEFAFDIAKKGTIAEDAHLRIDQAPTVCYCLHCGIEFQPINELNECPQCHQISAEIRQGKEFEIEFLEIS